MLVLLAGLLLLVMVAPILIGRDKRLFYGLNLYCFLNAILIIPGILVVAGSPELLNPDIYFAVRPTTGAIAWTMLMLGLLNVMVFAGFCLVVRREGGERAAAGALRLQPYETNLAIALLMSLAFAIFLQKLSLFGGLAGIASTVQNRVALQTGLGPVNFLASAATILATIIAVRRTIAEPSATGHAVLVVVALASMVMFSLFGGRKDSIQLAVMILAIISIYRPGFLNFNLRTLVAVAAAYLAALLYFVTILVYRSGLGGDLSMGGFIDQLASSFDSYQEFLISLSYADTYFFVTNFFDASTSYNGATFHDLLTAFVPSGLMPDKPAVDDGMFVRAATLGYLLQPGTPAYLVNHNSFPPETLGTAYMNGGAWLVAPFGLLLGAVLGKAQQLIGRFPASPFVIAVYLNIFLNFEISNLRITQLIAQSGFVLLLIVALRGLALLVARPQHPRPWAPQASK